MFSYQLSENNLTGTFKPSASLTEDDYASMAADVVMLSDFLADVQSNEKKHYLQLEYASEDYDENSVIRHGLKNGRLAYIYEFSKAKLALRALRDKFEISDNGRTGVGGLAVYNLTDLSAEYLPLMKQHILCSSLDLALDLDHGAYFDRFIRNFIESNRKLTDLIDLMAFFVMAGKRQSPERLLNPFYRILKANGVDYQLWKQSCLKYTNEWIQVNNGDIENAFSVVAEILGSFCESKNDAKKIFLGECADVLPRLGIAFDNEIERYAAQDAKSLMARSMKAIAQWERPIGDWYVAI